MLLTEFLRTAARENKQTTKLDATGVAQRGKLASPPRCSLLVSYAGTGMSGPDKEVKIRSVEKRTGKAVQTEDGLFI